MSQLSPVADALVSLFRQLQGPVVYRRDNVADHAMFACPYVREGEVHIVGDYNENDTHYKMVVQDLRDAGLWPPQKHDRLVVDEGLTERSVQDVVIDKIAGTSVFVMLRVVG